MSQEIPPESSTLQVACECEGKIRLDRFLTDHVPDLSRAQLQKLIRDGAVTVNGSTAPAKIRVNQGDRIAVQLPEPDPGSTGPQPQALPLRVLWEDEHLLVIDKEEGACVHPGAGVKEGTVVNALLHHCGGKLSYRGGPDRPGIVHRLDKDTSGCLVAAKTDPAHEALQRSFARREVRKEYLCVARDRVRQDAGTIENHLGRNPGNRKKIAVVPAPAGKFARTDWRVLARGEDFSVVQCRIATGRTHQIRVHLAYTLGHPILGDVIYGRGTLQRPDASRLMLHAWRMGLEHPVTGEFLRLEAPLPACFERFLLG